MHQQSQITRRTVLKTIGAAGVGACALPYLVPGRALAAGGGNRKLNLALMGCGGRMGQILRAALQEGDNVAAICDVDRRQIAQLMKRFGDKLEGAKVYEDYRKLLESEKRVDAVVIAAGQRWHVPMSKAAMLAGKHVFCEKPLAHSCAEAREIRELSRQSKLATQLGSQGGSTDTFRRSMEVIQAGMLGKIREVHCWITRTFPPSAPIDTNADPIPEGLHWDFWCGPSPLLPYKSYYIAAPGAVGCLHWGRWLAFGDGHLADMGAHGLNLPWRALKLGAPMRAAVTIAEPLKDSYPSANDFRWDFAARPGFEPVSVWWHDGPKAGPPEELGNQLLSTYGKVPTNGVLFAGENGILLSDAWGVGGVVKLKGDRKCRGVNNHEAGKSIPVTLPRVKDHMREWLDACKGEGKTFQGFDTAACVAEIAMVGMVAMRLGQPVDWDTDALKVKGIAGAERFVHLEQRMKWL
jgi:hypothetical protein